MKKNLIRNSVDVEGKKFCPICILSSREIRMVFDDKEKTYKCNYCQYLLPKSMNAVGKAVLMAGNEPGANIPYVNSVSFSRKFSPRPDTDKFNNPLDAWNS